MDSSREFVDSSLDSETNRLNSPSASPYSFGRKYEDIP